MKFRFEIWPSEMGGMQTNDVVVEAPTKRIAEYKVISRFPEGEILNYEITALGRNKKEEARGLRRFFISFGCCYLIIFTILLFKDEFTLSAGIFYGAGLGCVLFIFLLVFFHLIHELHDPLFAFLEGSDPNAEEHNASWERVCSLRMGYRAGWSDCERGAEPQFLKWDEEEKSATWPY
jgi:hypothetical protein